MNYPLLSKLIGTVLLLIALVMFACLGYAWIEGGGNRDFIAVRALGIAAIFTLAFSIILLLMSRNSGSELLRKEAIVVVGLSWIFAALFGSLPYLLCGTGLNWAQALFESMSGYTATGATVISDLDIYPRSILLYRATTQWLGGLGILVLFVAVLSYLGVGSKAIFRHESSVHAGEGSARIQRVALNLWLVYITFTGLCVLGLRFVNGLSGQENLSWYDAITHAFTTVATGGFSPYNDSVGHFDSVGVEVCLIVFMLLSSLNFMLYTNFMRQGLNKRIRQEEETKCFFLAWGLAIAIACLVLVWQAGAAPLQSLRQTAFHVTSLMTTTGYATTDYGLWPLAIHVILLMVMILGGCSGSTSGGMKISRALLFLRISKQEIKRSFRPGVVYPLHLNGRQLDEKTRSEITFYVAMVAALTLAATIIVTLIEPSLQDFKTAVSSVIATLFNIGPGLGDVGPINQYSGFLPTTYLFYCLLMLLGRLELFAILVLFMPSLWRKF